MTEQAEQRETNESKPESKSIADMSLQELQAEVARIDQELAQAQPPRASSSSEAREPGRRTPFVDARTGADLSHEIAALQRNLLREYEGLQQDSRFNDDHRTEEAWKAYDKAKPAIEEKAKVARQVLLKNAEHLEQASIPFPSAQALRTDDMQQRALTQGERTRIVERLNYKNPTVERMKAAGKRVPASAEDIPGDILREEYARGLDVGGVAGGAISRAALQVAQDRGIGVDEIVDEHRSEWQKTYLQDALHSRIQAQSIYSKVPLPSSQRPGGAKSVEELSAGKKRSALGLTRKSFLPHKNKQRRPSWK